MKIRWPATILLLLIFSWGYTIYEPTLIAQTILKTSDECPSGSLTECKDILSALGASGGVFGALNSLFSGLALFAVAYTLWSDANARRESRKPLVTNQLDDNSIIIKNPEINPEPKISLYVSSKVFNINGEAALNVTLRCQIKADGTLLEEFESNLSQPLASTGTEEVEKTISLKGDQLAKLLTRLTVDDKPIEFIFEIEYQSLENIKWLTEVTYDITCRAGDRRKRLNSLRSKTDDFELLWNNGAEVQLEAQVRGGSWVHHRK